MAHSTPYSSAKRRRRDCDDEDTSRADQRGLSVGDFQFEEMVSQIDGGSYLIDYQDATKRDNVMLCMKKPEMQRVKEEELVDAERAMEKALKNTQTLEQFLNEGYKALHVTKQKLGIAQGLLENVRSVKHLDSVEPDKYTVDTVESLCASIHFLTWSLEKIAKHLKLDSMCDIDIIPHKRVLTKLLAIAQKQKLYQNQHFIEHMKKLNNGGYFHKGFDLNRIIKSQRLTDESARLYTGIVFNVHGCLFGRLSEDMKFAPKFRESDGRPWCRTWNESDAYQPPPTPQTPAQSHSHAKLYPHHLPFSSIGAPLALPFSPMAPSPDARQASFGLPPAGSAHTAYMAQATATALPSSALPSGATPTVAPPPLNDAAQEYLGRPVLPQATCAGISSSRPVPGHPGLTIGGTQDAPFSFHPGAPSKSKSRRSTGGNRAGLVDVKSPPLANDASMQL